MMMMMMMCMMMMMMRHNVAFRKGLISNCYTVFIDEPQAFTEAT